MNKIGTKGSQFDTIYSRNHPISADINTEKDNFTVDDQSTAARKRLFAKKSEKNTIYDPNMSICSNNSSISSTGTTNSSVPTSFSMSFSNNNQRQSRPAKVFDHVQHNIKLYSSNKTSLKVKLVYIFNNSTPTFFPCFSTFIINLSLRHDQNLAVSYAIS